MTATLTPTRALTGRPRLAPAQHVTVRPLNIVLRRMMVGFVLLAALTIAAVAVLQTRLIGAQQGVDNLRSQLTEAHAESDVLRQQLVDNNSPSAVMSEATLELGMVEAPAPVVLSASGDGALAVPPTTVPADLDRATTNDATSDDATNDATNDATSGGTAQR